MARRHNKEDIFNQALKLVLDKKLLFIEDVVSLLPIHKSTFYNYYPPESPKFEEIKAAIDKNRVEIKVSLRSKWYKSDAPALQIALMRLVATDDELKKLSMNHHDVKAEVTTVNVTLNQNENEKED